MDLQSLTLLVEIIDSGNLSQAARKLKTSRANVSYHLTKLEKSLGLQLVRRTTRRVEPTEVGLRLYQHGRYGLDGKGRNALTTCLDYHDQLIAECTPAQLIEAQAEMHRRAARGHAVRVTEEGVAA